MTEHILGDAKHLCEAFFIDTDPILSWTWDGRLYCALAQLDLSQSDPVAQILEKHFGAPWTSRNLNEADTLISKFSTNLGGLRPEQRLYTSTTSRSPVICCAWWPWGNGKTISVRVMPTAQDFSEPQMTRLIDAFRTIGKV